MAATTIRFAYMFIVLGIVAYVGSGAESVTALIPTFFGIILLALGMMSRKESMRKHAMHAAAALGVIGFVATAKGLITALSMIGGAEVGRPAAVITQAIMAVLCAIYVWLAVKSFIDARKARQSAG